jgi:hypothetical protein
LAHTYIYPCCSLLLHLGPILNTMHFTLKMEAVRSSKRLVSYHITTQCHNQKIEIASKVLWNVGILPQYYTVSHPKRLQFEFHTSFFSNADS